MASREMANRVFQGFIILKRTQVWFSAHTELIWVWGKGVCGGLGTRPGGRRACLGWLLESKLLNRSAVVSVIAIRCQELWVTAEGGGKHSSNTFVWLHLVWMTKHEVGESDQAKKKAVSASLGGKSSNTEKLATESTVFHTFCLGKSLFSVLH